MNKITTQVKVVMLLSIFVLVPNIIFAEQVTATPEMTEPETSDASEITQAYPTEDKYWFMNIFSENNVEEDRFGDPTSIQHDMDYWSHHNNASNCIFGRTVGYVSYHNDSNDPAMKYTDIFSSSPDITFWSSDFRDYEKMGWDIIEHYEPTYRPYDLTYIEGGYKIFKWGDYNRISSNVSMHLSSYNYEIIDERELDDADFDWFMNEWFNISHDVVFSRTNLSAYKLNAAYEAIEIDNPLFFNATQLFESEIGNQFQLNEYNLTLTFKNSTYYKLSTFRPNLANITVYVKPTGEVWCYELNRVYEDPNLPTDNSSGYTPLLQDRIQFWFGWHHYVQVYSFDDGNNFQWELFAMISIPVLVVTSSGIAIGIKKKKNKENE